MNGERNHQCHGRASASALEAVAGLFGTEKGCFPREYCSFLAGETDRHASALDALEADITYLAGWTEEIFNDIVPLAFIARDKVVELTRAALPLETLLALERAQVVPDAEKLAARVASLSASTKRSIAKLKRAFRNAVGSS